MTAVALGVYFKVPAEKIKAAIEGYIPSNNRSQIVHQGSNTYFLDAYNANPSSMKVALETLHSMQAGQKIAILGDMRELGTESLHEHQAILRIAARYKFDQLVVVGPEFGRCDPKKYKALHFSNAEAAKSWFDAQDIEHAFILIKASRGLKLEHVVRQALKSN
jgi:UDP-N-acetylmuramoyl-tripeptide--D-alanyl-D-alanine ligase